MSAESSLRFGFRRRCAWCGLVLRGWQLNMCRGCKARTNDAGIYLQSGGPRCSAGAMWDAEPDRWSERPVAASTEPGSNDA